MGFHFKEIVRKQLTSQSKWWKLENNGNCIQIAEEKFPALNSVPGKTVFQSLGKIKTFKCQDSSSAAELQ